MVPAAAHKAEVLEVRGATLLPWRVMVSVAAGVIDRAPSPRAAAVTDDEGESLKG